MTKLTNRLLAKAGRLAAEMQDVQQDLTDAFEDRYGATYSAVDADAIIDVLDVHGGSITLEECDQHMTEAGHPPLKEKRRG